MFIGNMFFIQALINSLGKFSHAIGIVHQMQQAQWRRQWLTRFMLAAFVAVLLAMMALCVRCCFCRKGTVAPEKRE